MSIIAIKQVLTILISVLGSIFAFMNFVRKKNDKGEQEIKSYHIIVLSMISLVIISYVGLSIYLEIINRDQITAELHITVADPRIVNINGSQTDSFVEDADYLVVAYNRKFVIDATVIIENTRTKEQYTYHPLADDGVFTFKDFKSGEYNIVIFTGNKEIYRNTIILDRANVFNSDGTDVWDFTAFTFNDFMNNTKKFSITLSTAQFDKDYPIFTLHDENSNTCLIFPSRIDPAQDNRMEGSFYGYPGQYVLNNAITDTEMEPFVFYIEE